MFAPSRSRIPRFSVLDARSEPARSISESFDSFFDARSGSVCSTLTWRTAWEREVDFLREIQYADTRLPYYPDPTLPGAYDDLAYAEVPGYGPMYGPHLPHDYDEAHLTEVRQITRDLDRMWVR